MIGSRKSIFFKIFSILLSFTVMCYMSPMTLKAMVDIASVKENKEDLQVKNEKLKKKLQEIEGKVEDREAYAKTLQEQRDVLKKQVSLISDNVDSLNSEVDSLQKKINFNEDKVKNELAKFQNMSADVYMTGGEISFVKILLNCKDIKDAFYTLEVISIASESQAEIINQINEDTEQIKQDVEVCEKKRSKVVEEKESLESKNQELKDANEKVQQVIKDLKQDKSEAEQEIDINSAEIRALDAQEAEYYRRQLESSKPKMISQDESESTEDSSSESQSQSSESGGSFKSKREGYIWPVSCKIITDRFGVIDYTLRGGRMHYGIDIGASYGSDIRAAQSGTVIGAEYIAGYGNCVRIDHGGGCSTLYAHMRSMCVSSGDSVSQGDVIGQVGNTGGPYAPHLHFETRRFNKSTGEVERYDPLIEFPPSEWGLSFYNC